MFEQMLPPLTDHIKQQRKRLGGHWALALALFSRKQREKAREMLGNFHVFFPILDSSFISQISQYNF